VERAPLGIEAANGGFPEPPDGPVRVVSARHPECGAATRLRLPVALSADVVRRVQCVGCAEAYETEVVVELGLEESEPTPPAEASKPRRRRAVPRPRLPQTRLPRPRLPRLHLPELRVIDPSDPAWRTASVPIAAVAVIGGLMALQRLDGTGAQPASEPAAAAKASAAPAAAAAASDGARKGARAQAQLVRGSSFSVALPQGWERVPPQGGATFAAVSAAGDADATLWIERDPSLDFARFEARSLDQLRALAGSARVVERVAAPRPEATVVRLAAVAPPGQPEFEVTLRASGPYRYYLATTVQPDASRAAIEGAELIHGSFTPEAASRAGS
jgi:hypothetical protein